MFKPVKRFRVLYDSNGPLSSGISVSVLFTRHEAETYLNAFKGAFEIVEVVKAKKDEEANA